MAATGGINAQNAFIAGSDLDAIYLAPLGTPLPTSITDELDSAFEHVGWLHSDGITEAATGSKTEIRGHQGQKVVRTRIDTPGTNFAFTALESKPQTNDLRYVEKDVTITNGVRKSRRTPGQKVSPRAAVIDTFDADFTERKIRRVIDHVDITPNGDRTYSGTDIAGYPFLADVISDYDTYETLSADTATSSVEPALTSVSPTTGAAGATITLTGTGFLGATQVRFGSSNARWFRVVSDTQIRGGVPAGTAGCAAIKVIMGVLVSDSVAFTRS